MLEPAVRVALDSLAPGARRLVAAVSGGADSVALLRALAGGPWAVHVAHFDHGLRPDSGEDAAFVVDLAAALGLPFLGERADVAAVAQAKGWNLEEGARRLRYAFLTRAAKAAGADAIATAHTLDDQAETALLQLLRGAAYLTGMPARRGRVVRPLLEVSRADILAYLSALEQPYRDDETNRDTTRTRAWLRHDILPALESRFPSVKRGLARHAGLQRDALKHLETLAQPYLLGDGADAARLAGAAPVVQRQAIAALLREAGVGVDAATIERLRLRLPDARPFRLSVGEGVTARLAYGRLAVVAASAASLPEAAVTDAEDLPPGVASSALGLPNLVCRSRRPGDRIRLPSGTKKLSDLLIDCKIPREDRDGLRVLASGARVIWVEGVATDPEHALPEDDPDAAFMAVALEQARIAAAAGELPVGAVVVRNRDVLARAHNETEARADPSAHAEVLALRAAAQALGDWRLEGCTLYVTLEPCPMCFGAMLQAHLPRLVYGAANHREGALGSVADLSQLPWKRRLALRGGVGAAVSAGLLQDFFAARRGNSE